jgi:hypothetical protein
VVDPKGALKPFCETPSDKFWCFVFEKHKLNGLENNNKSCHPEFALRFGMKRDGIFLRLSCLHSCGLLLETYFSLTTIPHIAGPRRLTSSLILGIY